MIWQDREGKWSLFPTAAAGGGFTEWTTFGNSVPENDSAVDVAIGMGWNTWGQGYQSLQVAYLTAAGKICTVWQDSVGQWLPYSGQDGTGLP